MVQLGEHFKADDRSRHSEWLRQQRWFIKSRQDHQRREGIADKTEDGVAALASEAIMATQAQIKTFEVKLDSYDEATVNALMDNRELLDAVYVRLESMLAQAYVMEDGRRVFKTEDGTQVFDEFGTEVDRDEIDPLQINDNNPTWEAFSADLALEADLNAQRSDLLEFQEKLDGAREQVAGGETSEADLAELDADLLDAMPPAVRDHVGGLEPVTPALDLTSQFKAPAALPVVLTPGNEGATPAPVPI